MPPNISITVHGEDRVLAGHPWVFKSDIRAADAATPGDIVTVRSLQKKFLGVAFYNPNSQITLRFITRKNEPIDRPFWKQRLEAAVGRRSQDRDAARMVFGESDLMPGLILDRYKDLWVLQTLTLGMDRLQELFIELLEELFHPAGIVERNDVSVREREGLAKQKGILRGGIPDPFEIVEAGKIFQVDPLEGQKTGLYLDQTENRLATRRFASGRVLDLFCYQGGFSIQLADQVEQIIAVDSSSEALAIAQKNLTRNQITNVSLVEANVFDTLHSLQAQGERFDTILLDPPPFVGSKQKLEGGMRGYKEINLRAMKLLRPGGILVTSSCSQNFNEAHFYSILVDAAQDTRREIQVLEKRGAAPDHPVLLTFPESFYLQCWILRVL